MEKVIIEVCCGSVDDVVRAAQAGADRVELNSALFVGGLTPSVGAVLEAKARVDIPIISMIRPRAGGFCYTDLEFETMLRDTRDPIAEICRQVGYGDIKHFTRTFKAETGVTPGEYRKLYG